MSRAAAAFLIAVAVLLPCSSCAGIGTVVLPEEAPAPPHDPVVTERPAPETFEQPPLAPPGPETPAAEPEVLPGEPPELPELAPREPVKVKPVKLPWKRVPVDTRRSREFNTLAEFFRLNLNIKDIERTTASAAPEPGREERETVPMPVPVHAEMASDGEQELSVLEKTLRDKGIFDPAIKTLSEIARAADLVQHKVKVGETEIANPFRLREVTYCLKNPLKTILVSQQIADRLRRNFNRKGQNLSGLLRECAKLLDLKAVKIVRSHNKKFMPSNIIESFTQATSHLNSAFEKTGNNGREHLSGLAAKVLGGETESKVSMEDLLTLATQVDHSELTSAASVIIDRLTPYNLSWMAGRLENLTPIEKHLGVTGDVLYFEKTDFGLVVVGGKGRNIYTEPAALIVDLGGDDIYLDGAAVATAERPFSIIIDYGGDDSYLCKEAGPCSASCGVAILLDFAGDDIYKGASMCEGWASFGVAVLADFGGDDTYRATRACQGGAIFGIGLLLDTKPDKSESNDTYIAERCAQGFGCLKGLGAIVDTAGDDFYRAYGFCSFPILTPDVFEHSCSQGFGFGSGFPPGFDGGMGMLIDLEGSDRYFGKDCSQGSSVSCAYGLLYDAKGNDTYAAGRSSQGSARGISVASLIDWEGSDGYASSNGESQGWGQDRSVGCFFDAAGDDYYISKTMAQGAADSISLGLLIDLAGKDSYKAESKCQGFGALYKEIGISIESLGALFDMGNKKDTYIPHKKNNAITVRGKHGVLIDK